MLAFRAPVQPQSKYFSHCLSRASCSVCLSLCLLRVVQALCLIAADTGTGTLQFINCRQLINKLSRLVCLVVVYLWISVHTTVGGGIPKNRMTQKMDSEESPPQLVCMLFNQFQCPSEAHLGIIPDGDPRSAGRL